MLLEKFVPQFYGIQHAVCQYVDNSNNVIGTDNCTEAKNYLKYYHILLQDSYKANKLQMNRTKMTFICTRKPRNEQRKLEIELKGNKPIKEVKAMKILGFWQNNKNSLNTQLGKVLAIAANNLDELRPLLKHLSMKNRREVINSKCTSVITYGLELYFGQTLWTRNRLTALIMRNNRAIYQKDYYKVSNRRICNEIGFDEPYILCKKAAYRFIHKTIRSQKPPQLYEMLKFNQNHRECSRIGINDAPSKK